MSVAIGLLKHNEDATQLDLELDKTHITLLTKMLDTLRAFVPECHFNISEDGVSLTNLDDTHTVAVMGLLNKAFFTRYIQLKNIDQGELASTVSTEETSEGFSINLEELFKILKSSTRTTSANLKINPLKIEVTLTGADQRRKSHFNLDTLQNNDKWDDLSKDIQTNITEYPYQIEISNVDFKEILASIKIFKTEQVILTLQGDLLTFKHGEHRIDYVLASQGIDGSDKILEEPIDTHVIQEQKISVQLGTERLLYLSRALLISSFTRICISSEYHPVYFCLQVEDDPHNQLVVALSPRDG